MKLYVDVTTFFSDFKKSYFDYVKPMVEGVSGNYLTDVPTMQTRLVNLSNEYSNNTNNEFTMLNSLSPTLKRYISGSQAMGSSFPSNASPTIPFYSGGTVSPFQVKPAGKIK